MEGESGLASQEFRRDRQRKEVPDDEQNVEHSGGLDEGNNRNDAAAMRDKMVQNRFSRPHQIDQTEIPTPKIIILSHRLSAGKHIP